MLGMGTRARFGLEVDSKTVDASCTQIKRASKRQALTPALRGFLGPLGIKSSNAISEKWRKPFHLCIWCGNSRTVPATGTELHHSVVGQAMCSQSI